ncbi:MAG: hypothetical protein IPK97_16280 [Ahniella sp.]|nr:hypothetical protein [Ahniella sp.]
MSRLTLLLTALCLAGSAHAMEDKVSTLAAGTTETTVPELDMAKTLAEDAAADAKGNPGGWRYAVPFEVSITPQTHGKWIRQRDGNMRWTYEVKAPGAAHLNFGFTRYWLPEGAELRVEASDGTEKIRPFTSADNESHRELWTPPVSAQAVTLSVTAPADVYRLVELDLTRINQGYRGFSFPGKVCKSGTCNTDVACLGSSDTWNRERRAVASIGTSGNRICSASLVNNSANNRRMLLATASHCEITAGNAASLVAFWNFESPTCRRPGSTASGQIGVGPENQFQTGAIFLAATPSIVNNFASPTTKSDWTLLELDDPANPAFNLFWGGWDRRDIAPTCSVPSSTSSTIGLCATIHHPSGDEKRITFGDTNAFTANYIGGQVQNMHWRINWDLTPPILPNITGTGVLPTSVTEGGSSGSPLYNSDHRLVGVLSGGFSACDVAIPSMFDDYGKLAHAWDGLGTSATRMRDHLDPVSSGVTTLDGLDSGPACNVTATLTASSANPSVDTPIDFTLTISGGTGPYQVAWDVDDDGVIDRTTTGVGSSTTLSPRYVRATSTTVKATVTDAGSCSFQATRAINVSAPDIVVTESAPVQTCGDNDAVMEPGERWNIPVSISNSGGNGVDNGVFVFAPGSVSGGGGSGLAGTADSFGYTRADSTSQVCRFQAINMAAAQNLTLVPAGNGNALDDGAAANLQLGPTPFNYYGRNLSSILMSTNGYLATAQDDGGGEFQNSCGIYPTGPENGYLQVLHDDLVVQSGGSLRRAYFSTCPRPSDAGAANQGCTVFEWNNVGRYVNSTTVDGNAVVQAILYDQSYEIVYQYVTALPGNGASATIGIQDYNQSVRNEYACNTASAPASRSVCFFHPTAQPGASTPTALAINGRPFVRANALASGGSVNATIPVQVPTTAQCGSSLSASYLGMVDDKSFSARSKNILSTTVGGGGSCNISACGLTAPAVTLPKSGLYQNLNRLGSGTAAFNIPRDADTQFASIWYTAKADRSPYWYTQGGNWNSLRTQVETDLTETRQTGTAPFAVSRSSVGKGWVTYLDDSNEYAFFWNLNGTMVGEKQLRFVNETGFVGDTNRSGGWFNPNESGWGATVTDFSANGQSIRGLLAFLFDADGEPRWMTASSINLAGGAPINASLAYTHCPVCPNFADFGNTTKQTGTMGMSFSSSSSATFNSNLTFPADISGTWNRSSSPMILITPPYQP